MNGLMMRWPEADASAVALLKEAGASRIWLPWEAPGARRAFIDACHAADIRVIAELESPDESLLGEANAAGFDGVAFVWEGDEQGLRRIEEKQIIPELYVLLANARIGYRTRSARPVLRAGLWPGAQRPEPEEASATRRSWVNCNVHLVAWLRAMFPDRTALLGYRPDEAAGVAADQRVPYWSVELAMAEAAVAGGGVVVTLPEPYRKALLAGEGMAREAWASLARTSRYLAERSETFRAPLGLRVGVLAGPLEECGEILNLMYRFNVSPAVLTLGAPGPLERFRVIVAVGLAGRASAAQAALAFARSGGTVLAVPVNEKETPWWRTAGLRRVKSDDGRDVYSLGGGTLIAYHAPVHDPGELAEDVLDALGWSQRDLRIWGSDVLIGLLRRQPAGVLSVDLLNYAARSGQFLLRLEGKFSQAELQLPGEKPRSLRAAVRGSGTEIEVPRIPRTARVVVA